MLVGKSIRLSPDDDQDNRKLYTFSLLLHQGGALDHGAIVGTVDWELKAESLQQATIEADAAVYAENGSTMNETTNWWTRTAVQEVK